MSLAVKTAIFMADFVESARNSPADFGFGALPTPFISAPTRLCQPLLQTQIYNKKGGIFTARNLFLYPNFLIDFPTYLTTFVTKFAISKNESLTNSFANVFIGLFSIHSNT